MVSPLIWIALAVFFIAQQFQARPLKIGLLLVAPLILAYYGLRGIDQLDSVAAITFFAVNAAVAVAFGVWRGSSFRLWASGGQVWRQGTILTLALWGVSLAARLVLIGASRVTGLVATGGVDELMLLLALTFGAQNLMMWWRSTALTPAAV